MQIEPVFWDLCVKAHTNERQRQAKIEPKIHKVDLKPN